MFWHPAFFEICFIFKKHLAFYIGQIYELKYNSQNGYEDFILNRRKRPVTHNLLVAYATGIIRRNENAVYSYSGKFLPEALECCLSCSCVFITMGPYQATGSCNGYLIQEEIGRLRPPACTTTSSPLSNSIMNGCRPRGWCCVRPSDCFGGHSQRTGSIAEFSGACKDVCKSLRCYFKQAVFFFYLAPLTHRYKPGLPLFQ